MMVAPILLIDNDPGIGELTRQILVEADILNPLITALTPDIGLGYLNDPQNDLPVIVLLDIYFLDNVQGTSILKLIRNNPRTEGLCVFITSIAKEQEEAAAILGANKFLRKPPTLTKLLEAANDCGVQLDMRNMKP